MKTLKGVYLNGRKSQVLAINKDLEEYYTLLDCSTIDIVSREVNGVPYDIICDDEGLFKEKLVVTAIDTAYEPNLVGAIFVVAFDGKEDVRSLTEKEIKNLQKNIFEGILMVDY